MSQQPPTFKEAFLVWGYIALHSFGGPAAQIAVMHRVLVEERAWVSEEGFLNALNYCMLLPGPEAHQLITYMGWLSHGRRGGLWAGTLFILPGYISLMLLSILYAYYQNTVALDAVFLGLKAAVVIVVAQAVWTLVPKTLHSHAQKLWALAAALGLGFSNISFPLWIIAVGAWSWWHSGRHLAKDTALGVWPAFRWSVLLWGLVIWWLPIGLVYLLWPDAILASLANFFAKAAAVSFGGAYALLGYMAQQLVYVWHWLSPQQMLDGLSLAESTPGPLIQVVQFTGFISAYQHPSPLTPLWAGILGGTLAVWAVFVPSWIWIFLGAPYIEFFAQNTRLKTLLADIRSVTVGVIAQLALWFAVHIVFIEVRLQPWGLFHGYQLSGWRWEAALLMVLAGVWLWGLKQNLFSTLAVCMLASVLLHYGLLML